MGRYTYLGEDKGLGRVSYYKDLLAHAQSKRYSCLSEMVRTEYLKTRSSIKAGKIIGVSPSTILNWVHLMGVKPFPKGGDDTSRRKSLSTDR